MLLPPYFKRPFINITEINAEERGAFANPAVDFYENESDSDDIQYF